MRAYQTNKEGVYVGECQRQKHPFKKDEWLTPAGAILFPPPKDEPGKWRYNPEIVDWESYVAPVAAEPGPSVDDQPLDVIIQAVRRYEDISKNEMFTLLNYLLDRV